MKAFLYLFGGIWLLVGVPFFAVGASSFAQDRRFAASGRPVVGTVVTKYARASRRSSTSSGRAYVAAYRYSTPDGLTVHNEATMTHGAWDALREGGPIDVVYLPDSPASSRVRGETSTDWVFLPLGAVFSIVGAGCIVVAIRETLIAARLRREGVLTQATITGSRTVNVRINRVQQARVDYEFTDERGNRQRGSSALMSEHDAAGWREGQRVYVKYDREKPSRSLWLGPEPD